MSSANYSRNPATQLIAALLIAASLAAAPAAPAAAQTAGAAPVAGAAIVGRWTGHLIIRQTVGSPHSGKRIIDISTCGEQFCGRLVEADGKCGPKVLELRAEPMAAPDPAARRAWNEKPSHKGKLSLPGHPEVAADVYLRDGIAGDPARLQLAEAGAALYSRRIADVLSGNFQQSGPAACEAKTS